MKNTHYRGLANAIEDNFKGAMLTRNDMAKLLGKEDFNLSSVVTLVNTRLAENGLKLVNKRGYYKLMHIPYPEQLAMGTPYTERPTVAFGENGEPEDEAEDDSTEPEHIPAGAEEEHEDAAEAPAGEIAQPVDARSLKLTDVVGELKRRPDLIPSFNEIIAPLGKKLVVVGIRLELL